MPRGDGTGPMGVGPMTGRQMGVCAGNKAGQGYCGRGMGRGNGAGQGLGNGYGAQVRAGKNLVPLQQDELTLLKNNAANLETALNNVNDRISKIEEK